MYCPGLGTPRASRLLAIALTLSGSLHAQTTTEPPEGLRDHSPRWHAITDARLVLAPGRVVERGTLVMRDGLIVAAGAQVAVPAGARVWSMPGRTVYAGFIDLNSSLGVPAALRERPPAAPRWGPGADTTVPRSTPALTGRALAHSSPLLRAEQDLAPLLEPKPEELKAARELGFTTVLAAPAVGIFRGQSALVQLTDPRAGQGVKSLLLAERVAQHLGLDVDGSRQARYPDSLMGSIALLRQTWLDARWYGQLRSPLVGQAERHEFNAQLAALQPAGQGRQPVFFATDDEQDYGRIARLREELGFKLVLQGHGREYRRAAELRRIGAPLVLPLNFPRPPEVEHPDAALDVSLETLQHWEQAPSNPAHLQAAGIEFALTAQGLKDPKREFWSRLRQAVRRGLSADQALAALTTVPAKLVGESTRLGRLQPGHLANVVVAQGDPFRDEQAELELSFVDGRPYPLEAHGRPDVRGRWQVPGGEWQITGSAAKPALSIQGASCELRQQGRQLLLRLPCGTPDAGPLQQLVLQFHGEQLQGQLVHADGRRETWQAQRVATDSRAPAAGKPELLPPPLPHSYPAGAFAESLPPQPASLLLRGATLWTSASAGRLERADLLVQHGQIAAIGQDLKVPPGTEVLDVTGKHISPGLVDAHSHTAISRGINEGTHSITAQVRVGDVLDATDVNLYRELAGGVTTANLLHGSANTIGGQSQTIKLRWGQDAEALKFQGALPGIKFALGENVKQSNWGEQAVTRYPQTRMGVEQLLRDAFQTARHYQRQRATWKAKPSAMPEPRRDLQLDTLVELLEGQRAIHIHAYRADEILMFTRLAKEFGLRVATFQHVLEGYKVASEIASIGAGASTFSDWWAYKMEVRDAVPYNGAIMTRAGVLSSFNSDSDELARRLNTEAAKAVKYGGLSETEALKLVTINPARQLGVAARIGSLEAGKDADFVVWSGSPLSNYSRAEQTWIEGRRYFSLARDAQLRETAERERQRLLAKALPERLAALQAGSPKPTPSGDANAGSPSPVRDMLDWLDLQHELHQAARRRSSYWAGDQWHECTEDAR